MRSEKGEAMNDKAAGDVHWSFRIIGADHVDLEWSGKHEFRHAVERRPSAAIPEAYRAVINGRPTWATVSFAIAVFGGVLGCLLLLIRKSAALYVFIASLLGVIVIVIHAFSMMAN
jgi:hypothetical protein